MPSAFADRPQDIVPRTLRDLLAAEASQPENGKRRRRQRRIRTVRRVT
ncbi:hypothetical protein [Actinomadura chibensis]|nr:hypothetical protein [Actinomadura chibensis]